MYTAVIIDDEKWTLIDVKKTFPWEECGFAIVGETMSAQNALEVIQEQRPDFIITDIRMPKLSGIELIKKIRELKIDTEVIVISGFASFEYARSMLEYGAFAYCLKPLQRTECEKVFRRLRAKLDEKTSAQSGDPLFVQAEKIENLKFTQLVKKMLSSYQSDLTLTELSKEFGFNPKYWCALFSKELDTTFSKYLTMIRISAAKEMILSSRYSLDEIAEKVGYKRVFYFSSVFKRQVGCSPSEYRIKHKRPPHENTSPDLH